MNKLTVYQKLSKLFGPDGVRLPKMDNTIQSNKYSLPTKEIIRTSSREEADLAKLQQQQSKYLNQQWMHTDREMLNRSIQAEVTRMASFSDFEAMEFYPEIAAALDVLAEESTTLGSKGRMVNVYSNSKRVRMILEDLFENRLHVHTNLPMWTRNVCKYGENFLLLQTNDKAGVTGVKQMPNFEMERKELDLQNIISSDKNVKNETTFKNVKNETTFHWRGKDMTFKSWQIIHFRLLGDDRKLPYGTSIMEKARRIWKLLVLAEDAMLIYRVTRAPERRVFKINVGNIDEKDVPAFIDDIANKFKRTPVYDSRTGTVDTRYNQMAYDQDIFIPVRSDGVSSPIDTLPGAQNLDQISDIEYLQRKLFTAIRVPKSFIGFEESQGEGKNLALQDIRFTRTINRIQQAMIMELNKIAIIHLYMLGFEDELDNFSITMNNPSTQAELLKIDEISKRVTLFGEATKDSGDGFAAMSKTKAWKDIMQYSEDEIREMLLQQRMEKAAAAELDNTSKVIKHTGVFDKVDNIYGDPNYDPDTDTEKDGDGGDKGSTGGGGFGGGGLGGEDLDFTGGEDLGGEEGGEEEVDFGGESPENAGESPENTGNTNQSAQPNSEVPNESFMNDVSKLISENKSMLGSRMDSKKEKYTKNFKNREVSHMRTLLNSIGKTPNQLNENSKPKMYDKQVKFNEGINNMIDDLGKALEL